MNTQQMIVQLKRRHAHAGTWHAPGETLNVTETVGRWLIAQGIAFEVPAPAPKRPRKPKTTAPATSNP